MEQGSNSMEQVSNSLWIMANKCPLTNGKKVYAARNLYNVITHRINDFGNPCDGGNARGMVKHNGFTHLQPATNKLTLYPNPAKSIVNVACKHIKQVTIIDVMGREILTKTAVNADKVQLELNGLVKGIYLVKVMTSENDIKLEKLLIE